jgi:hypothetical protein
VRLRHAILRGALGLAEGARLPPVIMNWVFIVASASHSAPLLDRLRTAGVSIYSSGGKRGSVDVELKRQLQAFASMLLRREGVRVYIASGDCDFAADLRLLQEAGFEAGVIANASSRRAYVDQAEHVLSWEALVAQATGGGASGAAEPPALKARRLKSAPGGGAGGRGRDRDAAASPVAAAGAPVRERRARAADKAAGRASRGAGGGGGGADRGELQQHPKLPRRADGGAPARHGSGSGTASGPRGSAAPAAARGGAAGGPSASDAAAAAAAAAWCDGIAAWAASTKAFSSAPHGGLPLVELGARVAHLRPAGPVAEHLRLKVVLAGDAKRRFVFDGDGADAAVRLRPKRPAAAAATAGGGSGATKAPASLPTAARGSGTAAAGAGATAARGAATQPRPRDGGAPARHSSGGTAGATGGPRGSAAPAAARGGAAGGPSASDAAAAAAAAAWCDGIAAWAASTKAFSSAPHGGLPLVELGARVAHLRPAGPVAEHLRLKAVLAGDAKRRFVVDGDGGPSARQPQPPPPPPAAPPPAPRAARSSGAVAAAVLWLKPPPGSRWCCAWRLLVAPGVVALKVCVTFACATDCTRSLAVVHAPARRPVARRRSMHRHRRRRRGSPAT